MRIEPECIGCLLNQILSAFKTLKPNVDKELILKTQKQLMEYMLEIDLNEFTAPLIGKYLYNLVGKALEKEDPYRNLKRKYNNLALKYYDEVKEIVANSNDPLFEAIGASALGNTVDFASQHKIELIKDLRGFTPDNFKINDYKSFKHDLEQTEKLVIIGDNTGEIVFDKVLIETIKKSYPNKEIVYAVRSTPIINDATFQDAKYIGLTDIVKVIESSPAPGIDFSNISKELEIYLNKNKCLVLSKGQGNFETLHSVRLRNKRIYYLLKAKCNLMERIFNVKLGSLIFKKKTNGF
jgi:damage-control phosphatase, subfamily I